MEKRNIMKTVVIGLVTIVMTVLATLLITGMFSGGKDEVNANTTKHARVVLNGQVVKEGKAKGYNYHAGMNGHVMIVEFEDGTEAASSPNNIVIWSE